MEPATEVLPSVRRVPSAQLWPPASSVAFYVAGHRKRFLDVTFAVAPPLRFAVR